MARLGLIAVGWIVLLTGCGVGLQAPENETACVPFDEETMRFFETLGVRQDVDACSGAWRNPCVGPHGEPRPECELDGGVPLQAGAS